MSTSAAAPKSGKRSWPARNLPGLLPVAAVSLAALLLASTRLFSATLPLSPLILAILIGLACGNVLKLPASTKEGIRFASKKVLRLAIIFLGFKLSVAQVLAIGPQALASILVASTSTLLFTVWLGSRMGVPRSRSLLLGAGVSICGASAVAAVSGVIGGEEEDAAFAISAITLYGTVAMFLYPVMRALLGIPDLFYSMWTGESVHEVAQVAAASAVVADQLRGLAATVKMIRVLLIVPLTLILSVMALRGEAPGRKAGAANAGLRPGARVSVPWFALLFFAMVLVNSFAPLTAGLRGGLVTFDTWIMTAAMAGLGLDISIASLRKIGPRAALLGALSSLFISAASAALSLILS
ncbi:MAG TPA: putative sulfate exporter family transporter [Rectinemataceae bacterium]|nr:putative sulfate exporter family transporter [Rectinemataceae bacterium]